MLIRHRTWQFFSVILLLAVAWPVQALERGPQGTIRVGIFHVEPFNIIDKNKVPGGLNVDLLKEISRHQKWTPEFVPVTWVEGLEGLQKDQIDLMVSVAYTPERAEVMDYSHESVLELWGQVFIRPEGKLKNINDLAGLRVGVMRKDINGSNFIKTAESLGVQCEIVEFPSYVEVFTAVEKNQVDAGIAHQHYGLRYAKAYNLVGSAMIFSPISIYFASKKGKHHELLGNIDAQLSQWKRDKDSYYYAQVDHWLGVQSNRTKIPRWLIYAAIIVAISLLIVSGFTLLLKRTVRIRTKELHESETTFRKLFEDSSDANLLIDQTGVFVECNQSALDLLKMTREQFLLLPPARISPEFQPDGRRSSEAAPEMIALAYSKGLQRFDWTCVNSEGGEFIIEVALMPVTIKGQTMLHTTWRDITPRKEAEESLIRQKYLLGKSQEIGLIGTWELDLAKNRLVWTDENCRIFGLPESSVVTYEIFLEKVHPEDREFVHRKWQSALSGDPYDIEHRILLADQVKWVREKAEIHFDGDGRPLSAIGFAQDITERKQAEVSLRESEERNRQIIHSSIDGFWRVDAQTRLIEVNEAYCRMSGYSREELLTMAVRDLEALESPEEVAARTRRIIDNGSDRFTTNHRRKDGRIFEVEASIQYRSSEDGGELAVFLRDVTEKRRLELQLRQAQKLEAIGTLAGGIAHDFNNILGAIVGYSEMIRDDFPPGSPSLHDINQVIKASHRAKDLVKQILAFSRQVEDQKIPVQPAVIVKEAIALLRSSLPTTITINQDIDPDAGMVLADPTQIHQIVMNLSTNAFHAMEVKGGTLTISLQKKILCGDDLATLPDLQPGTFVQLLIKDSGEGILPEIRERIFDPFFTTKEVGKGTGLGLSMVYSIVKSSGGSIVCDSRLGEGTEFCILLPVLEGHSVEENRVAGLTPHGKEHILLIDDEEMLAELGQAMLERLGYRVTTRTNSLDALTTFQNQPDAFDLIITDQTMPGMTGVDLARRILQIRRETRIILCTGYSSLINEDKARAIGIKGFAFKPLAKKDIGELIRKVLDGKSS